MQACSIASRRSPRATTSSTPSPAPDLYLEAARRLGVAPQRCVAFEDSSIGILAAHAAGMRAVMVVDILPPTDEARARCLHVAADLHEILGLMRGH